MYHGIYIPPGWYHEVTSADGAMAVSWYADTPDLRFFVEAAAAAEWPGRSDDECAAASARAAADSAACP